MTQSKDEWIQATGGLFASFDERQVRLRVRELADKLKAGALTEDERTEFLRLVESLPDTEE